MLLGSNVENASSVNLTLPYPSGWVDRVMLYAVVVCPDGFGPSSIPSGWSLVASKTPTTVFFAVYQKVAAGGDDTTPTWVWTSARKTFGKIVQVEAEYNTTDPTDVVSNVTYITNSSIIRAAAVTVAKNDSYGVFFGMCSRTTTVTFTAPLGWTEVYDGGGTTSDAWVTIADRSLPSGSTGNVDGSMSDFLTLKHAIMVVHNPLRSRRRYFHRMVI